MPAEQRKWNAEGRKIVWVEGTFLAASSNSDNTAEKRGMLNKRKEIGDKAQAGIVVQCG